jgi:hypothetical protein
MPKKKYIVKLDDAEREQLEQMLRAGKHPTRIGLGSLAQCLPCSSSHKQDGVRTHASRSCVPLTGTLSTSKPGTSDTSSGAGRLGTLGSGMVRASRSVSDSGGSSTRRLGALPPA